MRNTTFINFTDTKKRIQTLSDMLIVARRSSDYIVFIDPTQPADDVELLLFKTIFRLYPPGPAIFVSEAQDLSYRARDLVNDLMEAGAMLIISCPVDELDYSNQVRLIVPEPADPTAYAKSNTIIYAGLKAFYDSMWD